MPNSSTEKRYSFKAPLFLLLNLWSKFRKIMNPFVSQETKRDNKSGNKISWRERRKMVSPSNWQSLSMYLIDAYFNRKSKLKWFFETIGTRNGWKHIILFKFEDAHDSKLQNEQRFFRETCGCSECWFQINFTWSFLRLRLLYVWGFE